MFFGIVKPTTPLPSNESHNAMEDKEDTVSSGYARLREERVERTKSSDWTFQRKILAACFILVVFLLFGLISAVIALRVHLSYTSTNLAQNEGQISAYKNIINNLTAVHPVLTDNNVKYGNGGSAVAASGLNDPSVIYFRWGSSTCPDTTAQLVYEGVTASASSSLNGGGSNHLCMTLEPEFSSPQADRQEGRSHIYGSEYRNGNDYDPVQNLHGHDAPCAACLARSRTTVLMVPGTLTCPKTGNWTREYNGYLMAARNNLKRTSYICVDVNAEATPGSSAEHQQGDILFPVEAFCNSNTGGGLPCSPYVNGYEVTCVVCTL